MATAPVPGQKPPQQQGTPTGGAGFFNPATGGFVPQQQAPTQNPTQQSFNPMGGGGNAATWAQSAPVQMPQAPGWGGSQSLGHSVEDIQRNAQFQQQLQHAQEQQRQNIQTDAQSRIQAEHAAAQQGLQSAGYEGQGKLQAAGLQGQMGLQASANEAAKQQQLSSQAYGTQTLNRQAELQAAADQRRQAAMSGLLGQAIGGASGLAGQILPGGLGANIGGLGVGGGVGGPGGVGGEDAARAAAFGRAKDTAGEIGRSAVSALQQNMTGRGLGRSSLANQSTGQVINQGATQLGEVNREQAIQDLQNARQRASEQFQGGLTMRGQNLGFAGNALSGLMSGFRAY